MTRVCDERLVILSPLIYPAPKGWRREAVIATTMGPNKVVRAVQSFVRKQQQVLPGLDPMHGNALGQVGESHHLVSVGVGIEPAVETNPDGEAGSGADTPQGADLAMYRHSVFGEERLAVAVPDSLWERTIRRRGSAVGTDVLVHDANANTGTGGIS